MKKSAYFMLPFRKLGKEIYLTYVEIKQYLAAFRSELNSAAQKEIEKVDSLGSLARADNRRIRLVIFEAARLYHSARLRPKFYAAIERRLRVKAVLVVGSGLIIALILIGTPFPPANSWSANALGVAIVVVSALMILFAVIGSVIARLTNKLLVILFRLSTMIAVQVAFDEHDHWATGIQSLWRRLVSDAPFLHHVVKGQLENTIISPGTEIALWMFFDFYLTTSVFRFIGLTVKAAYSPVDPFSIGKATRQSAEFVIRLLHCVCLVEEIIGEASQESEDRKSPSRKLTPTIIRTMTSTRREELTHELDSLASFIKHDWAPAMASSNGDAGLWLAGSAQKMEFYIRYEKVRNMFTGNNILELRDGLISSLVHAADGDWNAIGSQVEYPGISFGKRWKRVLRKMISVILPLVAAAVVGIFSRGIPAGILQTVVYSCIIFSGLQLIALVDPDSPGRLDIAQRFSGIFKK